MGKDTAQSRDVKNSLKIAPDPDESYGRMVRFVGVRSQSYQKSQKRCVGMLQTGEVKNHKRRALEFPFQRRELWFGGQIDVAGYTYKTTTRRGRLYPVNHFNVTCLLRISVLCAR